LRVTDQERLMLVASTLERHYGKLPPAPEPNPDDPIEGLIETILSQQNVGWMTRKLYAALKAEFPTWDDALEAGPVAIQTALEDAGGGLARVKAKSIDGCLKAIKEASGELSLRWLERVPEDEAKAFLLSLPGVGQKTMGCVMMFDLRRAFMPVDTHIHRIAKRLGFVASTVSADATELWFDQRLPRRWEARYSFHVNAFEHGRVTCQARVPKCANCPILELCPSAMI
jgi:endonuclease III